MKELTKTTKARFHKLDELNLILFHLYCPFPKVAMHNSKTYTKIIAQNYLNELKDHVPKMLKQHTQFIETWQICSFLPPKKGEMICLLLVFSGGYYGFIIQMTTPPT